MTLQVAIKKRFAGFSLDVAFEAKRKTLGILGASGSGKSMTLKCIAGIVRPDEGRIAVGDRVLFDSREKINLKPQQRRVGYLLQSHALFPHLTVAQNIAEALTCSRHEKTARINGLLERFELSGLDARYPAQLSGGQQQRVAVARVLASEPDVLLLDEPFSALDAYLKETLQIDLLNRLSEFSGHSVMVTHDRDEAYKLCPSLLMLNDGRVETAGDTAALFASPGTVEAARLTGCKNISPARKVAAHTVVATDWNLRLTAAAPVPDDVACVGVRAHAFRPTHDPAAANAFPFIEQRRMESPFEWHVLFRPAGAGTGPSVWHQMPKGKQSLDGVPLLCVDPKDVLLLRKRPREAGRREDPA